jgi:deoxyribonuclease V
MCETVHRWDVGIEKAKAIQEFIRQKTVLTFPDIDIRSVAGVDIAYSRRGSFFVGALVMMSFPDLVILSRSTKMRKVTFPYIPGYLTFREGPLIMQILKEVKKEKKPDVIIFDGQGIAHPRRCGIATHIGVLLDTPAIGCAKRPLSGNYTEPDPDRGSFSELRHEGETIGAVLRTRDGVKPVFVSPGHRMDLTNALDIVLRCAAGYRLPEPVRQAHRYAGEVKRKKEHDI